MFHCNSASFNSCFKAIQTALKAIKTLGRLLCALSHAGGQQNCSRLALFAESSHSTPPGILVRFTYPEWGMSADRHKGQGLGLNWSVQAAGAVHRQVILCMPGRRRYSREAMPSTTLPLCCCS